MALDYDRLNRMLIRCEEVAGEAGIDPAVSTVYAGVLKGPADAFRAAHAAIPAAQSAANKETSEGAAALAAVSTGYATARAVVMAFVPSAVLPDTIKTLTTDTDRLDAIQGLLDLLDEHHGESWADQQIAGAFGQAAPATVKEITEAIAANSALSQAIDDRAAAYGPAWEKYILFKNVVRQACGPKSRTYHRIHIAAGKPDAAENGGPPPPAPPAPPAPPTT